jgi:hypothetical protein
LHDTSDHEGNDKEDYEAHNEPSLEARRAVGSHDLGARFAWRWQLAPNLSQALLSGPAEPVPSGMSKTSSFARQVASDHRFALYGRPMRRSPRPWHDDPCVLQLREGSASPGSAASQAPFVTEVPE